MSLPTIVGDAVDMAGDDMAAEFVADLEAPLEVDAAPVCHSPDVGDGKRFERGEDLEPVLGRQRPCPLSVTVRQMPSTVIEAPSRWSRDRRRWRRAARGRHCGRWRRRGVPRR